MVRKRETKTYMMRENYLFAISHMPSTGVEPGTHACGPTGNQTATFWFI